MAGPAERLCVAGGLGMNALLISALEQSKQVFVQPAAGNAGTALGAVFYAWNNVFGQKKRASLNDLCLGPSYTAEEVKQVLENCKLRFHYLMTTDELVERAVRDLNSEKIIAWMQGRMEFGPRALGNRSILASPLNPYSTENLNIYIKHREPFRKFAASVPEEMAGEYFEAGPNARYLATVGRVRAPYRKTFEARGAGRQRRARSHGAAGRQSAVSPAAACRRQSHRASGVVQHELQSVRRSAGVHAARCGAEFLFVRRRRLIRWKFRGREVTKVDK